MTMADIKEMFFQWPTVRGFNEKLAARHEIEQNNVRETAATRISELKAESGIKLPVLVAAADRQRQRVEAAKLELRIAERELDDTERERLGATFEFQAAIDSQRAILRRTASPKIDEAERELHLVFTRLRGDVQHHNGHWI
jgi:hypothetical protein